MDATAIHQPINKLIVTFLAFFGVFAFLTTSQCQGEKTPAKKKILPH
jgi:hypothetical protein